MAYLTWSEAYSVGIGAMDSQHRQLVDLLNQLHEAMKEGKGSEAAAGVLRSLVDYAKVHFTAEEKLMQANGFPHYAQHRIEHDSLTRQAAELQKKAGTVGASLSISVLSFLRDWLINHIKGSDMRYGSFLNGKGIH